VLVNKLIDYVTNTILFTPAYCLEGVPRYGTSLSPPEVPYYYYPFLRVASHRPFEVEAAKSEIDLLGTLQLNWDGYGGLAIQEDTKNNALFAAEQILVWTPMPDIAPNSNGTISMEWETEQGVGHLEIGRSRYSFYIQRTHGSPIFADGPTGQLAPLLGIIVSSVLYPDAPGKPAWTHIPKNVPANGNPAF